MADAKKPDKGKGGDKKGPPKSDGGGGPSMEQTMVLVALVAVMVIFVIGPTVLKVLGKTPADIFPADLGTRIYAAFEHFVTILTYISIFLSLVFICGIVYANVMYGELKRKLAEAEAPVKPGMVGEMGPEQMRASEPDPRWKDVEGLMQSGNPGDWRVAILEADILLDDMLTQMGYAGESIGEKLKQADRAHFKSLDDAWKAHKVRNNIAHEGAAYQVSRSDAEETIAMFKRVFDEFYFV